MTDPRYATPDQLRRARAAPAKGWSLKVAAQSSGLTSSALDIVLWRHIKIMNQDLEPRA